MKLTSAIDSTLMRGFTGIGKVATVALVAGAMLAGSATAQLRHVDGHDEDRNYDARITTNQLLAPTKAAPVQASALEAMGNQVSDLKFYIDPDFGVTRTLYNMTGYMSDPLKGASHSMELSAMDFVRANLAALGLQQEDLAEYRMTDNVFNKVTGATHIYWQQMHAGIPVYNGQLHVNINRDGRIISVNNLFVPGIANGVNAATPKLGAHLAVESAARHLGVELGEIGHEHQVVRKCQRAATHVAKRPGALETLDHRGTDHGRRRLAPSGIRKILHLRRGRPNEYSVRVDHATGRR